MEPKLRAFGRVLSVYLLAITALFALCAVMFGLKGTFWGFVIFFLGCFFGVLAEWWQEERKRSQAAWSKDPGAIRLAHVAPPAANPSG